MGGAATQLSGWAFACPDWEDRLRDGRSLLPDLPLDAKAAARAAGIFDRLRLPDVPGQPTMAEGSGEWLRDIVRAIAGSMIGGERMVREVFALVPKKNAKTTGGAAIALTLMVLNQRPRAEGFLVGPTQEVADLAFSQLVGMIEADETGYLQKRFHVAHHLKTVTDRLNKARLKVKTFDMKVATGGKPTFVLIDELHLMARIADAGRIIGQLRGGMIANPEAVMVVITTQSDEAPAGAFLSELRYARGVRDGLIEDGRTLPLLYEFPESVQRSGAWRDQSLWGQVLPNAGKSISVERLASDYRVAREKGEMEERRWASQHLNIEIGLALHSDRWAGADYWEGAVDPDGLTLDCLIARSEVAVVGIDGGGLDDLSGLAVIGRDRVSGDWLHWGKAWGQTDILDRRKENVARYLDFEADGDLVICRDQPGQDIDDIVAVCKRLEEAGLLPDAAAIGVDALAIEGILDALEAEGFVQPRVVAITQGYKLAPSIWSLERRLKDGTFRHGDQRLMAWAVSNAKVEQRGNAVLITKQAAGKAKIDPLMAALNAVALMGKNPLAAGSALSPWENPDFRMTA